MHLFVRLKKSFTGEMTFKLRHEGKKGINWSLRVGNAVAETGGWVKVVMWEVELIILNSKYSVWYRASI